MSRVTKLQKQYRAQYRAKWQRRVRARAKSHRTLHEQTNHYSFPYHITRRQRRDARQRSHQRCNCGHHLHGPYGCLQGCAWSVCDGVRFEPIIPSPLDNQFAAVSASNALALNALLSTFRLDRI